MTKKLQERWVRIMTETHDAVKIFADQERGNKKVIQKIGKQRPDSQRRKDGQRGRFHRHGREERGPDPGKAASIN